jgi:hypothetical protein
MAIGSLISDRRPLGEFGSELGTDIMIFPITANSSSPRGSFNHLYPRIPLFSENEVVGIQDEFPL